MTKQLSPAAKAVLDATNQAYDTAATVAEGTAVALRAAADQMSSHHSKSFLYSIADVLKLQTIADELKTQ